MLSMRYPQVDERANFTPKRQNLSFVIWPWVMGKSIGAAATLPGKVRRVIIGQSPGLGLLFSIKDDN